MNPNTIRLAVAAQALADLPDDATEDEKRALADSIMGLSDEELAELVDEPLTFADSGDGPPGPPPRPGLVQLAGLTRRPVA